MNAFVRLAGDIPSMQKSFFRNFIALIFAFILLKSKKIPIKTKKKENLKFLILRSVLGTIGILGNFYAVDKLVLADASMLNKMSPFFGVLFSFIFLKENLKPFHVIALVTAFLGSLFIIKPSFENLLLVPAIIGFIGGVSAGGAYTTVRYLGEKGESKLYIVFFFSSFSCLTTLPYLLFNYHHMSLGQLGFLILAGLAATGGQFSITAAYTHAPAREISVYDYSQVIFSAVLGYIIFQQTPDKYSFLGYAIIISMAVLMFFFNKKEHNKSELKE
ncbi:MAG: DMT family transporter [Clostridiales bacterium]|nr:DMT family transporter [Clostridiales bacterium]